MKHSICNIIRTRGEQVSCKLRRCDGGAGANFQNTGATAEVINARRCPRRCSALWQSIFNILAINVHLIYANLIRCAATLAAT